MTGLLIRDCEVAGRRVDVRVRDGVVVQVDVALRPDGDEVIDGAGGALIPGLHDHHLHLFALAAALESVDCSPATLSDAAAFTAALRDASKSGPVRAVGYFESVAGPLDRDVLDRYVADIAVRVQHRSGAFWFLNSAALSATGLLDSGDPAVKRDENGRATGRVVRGDHLLRRAAAQPPDLSRVSALLASYGVTGVTDATPGLDVDSVLALHAAQDDGALTQRTLLLGAPLEAKRAAGVPWKIVIDELQGLDPIDLLDEIRAAHAGDRPVAMHCTSRAETVFAVTTLLEAGPVPGDRLEHASILPTAFDRDLANAGVTVVTQPHFIAERGDAYLADVEPDDHALLYRCGSLIDAGVRVAFGTDAPFGQPDPWLVMAAATTRRTENGVTIADQERIGAHRALQSFLGRGLGPGGSPRRVDAGATADLCLLDATLDEVLEAPTADHVAAAIIDGRAVYRR